MNQFPTQQHMPTQAPAQKLSQRDRKLLSAFEDLKRYFWHGISDDDTHYLIEKSSLRAYPFEVEIVASKIKTIALKQAGTSVSRGIILDAVDILREEQPEQVAICYGRSVRASNGALYLQTSDGIVEFQPKQNLGTIPQQLPHIAFIQPENALPLPRSRYTSINNNKQNVMQLFRHLPLPAGEDLLILTWLITTWLPNTQNVLLELTGTRQSGKSSTQATLKRLVDPSRKELIRDIPQTSAATSLLALSDKVISLDNVEEMNDKVQTSLLRLLEGDLIPSKQKRAREETLVRVSCPVILNSLNSVVTNTQLLDSTLTIELTALPENNNFFGEVAVREALFQIFGDVHAELHAYSFSDIHAAPKPMRDFCRVGCLVAKSLGREPQEFLDQLQANRQYRYEIALNDNPTAVAIQELLNVSDSDLKEIPVVDLYEALQQYKPSWATNNWPTGPKALGAMLRKLQPGMLTIGIKIEDLGKRRSYCRYDLSKVAPRAEEITVPTPPTPSYLDGYQWGDL